MMEFEMNYKIISLDVSTVDYSNIYHSKHLQPMIELDKKIEIFFIVIASRHNVIDCIRRVDLIISHEESLILTNFEVLKHKKHVVCCELPTHKLKHHSPIHEIISDISMQLSLRNQ